MHSLTYTQKKLPAGCRQQRCICLYTYIFSPHANSSGQTSGQKVKKCIHYIYAKYPFFILKKCIHYIYTRNHISSRQQSFQRPNHYSSIPKTIRQQAEIGQITTNHYCSFTPHAYPHFAGNRIKHTTQQSQTTSAAKRYTLTQPQAYAYFFTHFSRFLQNGKQEVYIRPQKKKEKNDIKRHKKVLKGIKKG